MTEQQPKNHQPPPPGGGLPWGLSFLAFIPLFGPLVILIAAFSMYPGSRRNPNPVYRENVRAVLNWQVTLTAVFALGLGLFLLAMALDEYAGVELGAWNLMFAVPLGLVAYVAWIPHLIFCIMGVVRAGRGEPFVPPLAIPFVKRPDDAGQWHTTSGGA